VCEILRKDEATATVPILMITGLTGQLTRCAGMESGATEFVTKPFTVAQVVSKAKQMLANRPVPASAPANPLPITN